MAKFEFEWAISDPVWLRGTECVYVRERLVGHDGMNEFGPMPKRVADSFVRARRDMVYRNVTSRFDAMKLFEPRAPLLRATVPDKDDEVVDWDKETRH